MTLVNLFAAPLLQPVLRNVVAEEHASQQVCGEVRMCGVHPVQTNGYVESGGIVVSSQVRPQMIGRSLFRIAEYWPGEPSDQEVRWRSGLHRGDAQQFYVTDGYERSKASFMSKRHVGAS